MKLYKLIDIDNFYLQDCNPVEKKNLTIVTYGNNGYFSVYGIVPCCPFLF